MTVTLDTLSWYDVSPEVKRLLLLAAEHWENTELATSYINQAIEQADGVFEVLTHPSDEEE